ncbi:MAG: N-formylglutamate amidohydrolase [Roseivivax sp.]|nr:N-formylglutamate amidohydrolase [Roseivivax sp.]
MGEVVAVQAAPAEATLALVCEHASNRFPAAMDFLGLPPNLRDSHIAWDPGALAVAQAMAAQLNAPLVAGCVSRLVYDCNRPPEAPDAVPERSEVFDIPGNTGLSAEARAARAEHVYHPFRARLASEIAQRRGALKALVTMHSFTPVYRGVPRAVQIGILHGTDSRLADAMLAAPPDCGYDIRRNAPYDASDGVLHTLDVHAIPNGLLNVMIEVRNDLIATAADQRAMGALLAGWVDRALRQSLRGVAA